MSGIIVPSQPGFDESMIRWMLAITRGVNSAGSSTVTGDIWRNRYVRIANVSAGTATTTLGMGAPTGLAGVSVFPTPNSTSWLTSQARLESATTAAAGVQRASTFFTQPWLWLGNGTGLGGFRVEMVGGITTAVATTRFVMGIGTAAPSLTAADPSAATNTIFVGNDSADADLQLMHNDGAGTCTKIDLGAGYPANTSGVVVRLVLNAAQNATSVSYTVSRLDVRNVADASGSFTTDLPSNTTFLGPIIGIGTGATAAAATLCWMKAMTEEAMS